MAMLLVQNVAVTSLSRRTLPTVSALRYKSDTSGKEKQKAPDIIELSHEVAKKRFAEKSDDTILKKVERMEEKVEEKLQSIKGHILSRDVPTGTEKPNPTTKASMNGIAEEEKGGLKFELRQQRLGRPLSPHLRIYKPQITWGLSLMHRATAMTSTAMLYALGMGTLVVPNNFPYYVEYIRSLHIPEMTLMGLKFLIAWQVFFHLLNGIRHLVWDLAWGLEIPKVTRSGIVVLALTTVLAVWAVYTV